MIKIFYILVVFRISQPIQICQQLLTMLTLIFLLSRLWLLSDDKIVIKNQVNGFLEKKNVKDTISSGYIKHTQFEDTLLSNITLK